MSEYVSILVTEDEKLGVHTCYGGAKVLEMTGFEGTAQIVLDPTRARAIAAELCAWAAREEEKC